MGGCACLGTTPGAYIFWSAGAAPHHAAMNKHFAVFRNRRLLYVPIAVLLLYLASDGWVDGLAGRWMGGCVLTKECTADTNKSHATLTRRMLGKY